MTRTRSAAALAALALLAPPLMAQAPPPAQQVAAAVLAAPAERRADATVLGWDEAGAVITLRQGTNDLVCLADDPRDDAWSAACYHASLEPFMARGRELAAQGVGGQERSTRRFQEIEAGTLPFPSEPAMLYVLHGEGFDAESGEVVQPYLRWVIYTPFATAESTGLSTTPVQGAPWLMGPGTAGAHIMITPPRSN
ncbi:MAG TPA: hypothetical protein VMK65_04115 [Longimicrobiales bacterium]|nr:hypothetical protein [Longimicrobiales bacterium]